MPDENSQEQLLAFADLLVGDVFYFASGDKRLRYRATSVGPNHVDYTLHEDNFREISGLPGWSRPRLVLVSCAEQRPEPPHVLEALAYAIAQLFERKLCGSCGREVPVEKRGYKEPISTTWFWPSYCTYCAHRAMRNYLHRAGHKEGEAPRMALSEPTRIAHLKPPVKEKLPSESLEPWDGTAS